MFSSFARKTLREFTFAEIKKATNNFDSELVIWRGRFGEVYKGIYSDDAGDPNTVAIRRLNKESRQPPPWLEGKIEEMSQSCHKNIVSVIGYCQEYGEMMFIYEHMPHGSLANHLRTKTTSSSFYFPWDQCLSICIDAARGLEYMHTHIKTMNMFLHGDVTATNILLDGNGVGKISDLYSEPNEMIYTAYHWDPIHRFTDKLGSCVDVYAFGELLLKVLCRKITLDEEDEKIDRWLQLLILKGNLDQIIHPDMKREIPLDCLREIVDIACSCLDTALNKRPTFTVVVKRLESIMASSSQQVFQHFPFHDVEETTSKCQRYSIHEIDEATSNFENILGEGGEGMVYKGMTKANIPVAVKHLKKEESSEFEKEIKMLSSLNHPNLVSLIGFCHESDQKMLIYEYMCNGTLDNILYAGASALSWELCLNICIGAARGLQYLHTGTKEFPKGIIHRDVKPLNILLDENLVAKVSDFGLSKMTPLDQASNCAISTLLKGTIGYYAPEYLRYNQITRRIDVYAFGLVMSEVLCRKKPWDRGYSFYPGENEKYGQWARENVDPHLKDEISPYSLDAFTDTLEKCLDSNPDRRPSMNDVVSKLENALKQQKAWQKHNSEDAFYLPCGEDRVILYHTSGTSNLKAASFQDSLKLRLLLMKFRVPIDERDPSNNLYVNEFKQLFGNAKNVRLPQVIIPGKYSGGCNDTEKLYKTGELGKLLGVPHSRFICGSCGVEKACKVCKREEWFVLCKNCDALTKVSSKWKGKLRRKLRSCFECNGNQLIYGAYEETFTNVESSKRTWTFDINYVLPPLPY